MEFYVGLLLIAVAVLLVLWCFVGRRVGDEPLCRACAFDLTGLTEPAACPECGKDLGRPRAIATGHRRRQPRLAAWAGGAIVLGGGLLVVDFSTRSGAINSARVKPAFVLLAEAYVLDDDRAGIATRELQSRIDDERLGTTWRDRLVRAAVDRHGQTWRSFPNSQWLVITRAMASGELSFDQVEGIFHDCFESVELVRVDRYARNNMPLYPDEEAVFEFRINWRAGEVVPGVMIAEVGFPLEIHTRAFVRDADGERREIAAATHFRGPIIQRFVGAGGRGEYQRVPIDVPSLSREETTSIELKWSLMCLTRTSWQSGPCVRMRSVSSTRRSTRRSAVAG